MADEKFIQNRSEYPFKENLEKKLKKKV